MLGVDFMGKEKIALDLLSKTPELLDILDKELQLPNIPTPTMGGEVFWNTLAESNGWKMQQNMITHHARILNSENVRVAWGTVNGMYKAIDRLIAASTKYSDKKEESQLTPMESMEQLKELKNLLDMGIITEQEYNEKKQKLMKYI